MVGLQLVFEKSGLPYDINNFCSRALGGVSGRAG